MLGSPSFEAQQPPVLLLVDDDKNVLDALKRTLRGVNATIVSYQSPIAALEFCQQTPPTVVISDQQMPELAGCELLSKIQALWPQSIRIILSAYQDFKNVSSGFNSGAIDRYISKPWDNQELKFIVNKALATLPDENAINRTQQQQLDLSPVTFHSMLAGDPAMKTLFTSIEQAASSNAPIFITGETGTGKELVAKACHEEGFHQQQPFLAVNCANFTEELMESQLFGHVRGAFTGAATAHEGVLAAAKNGTLFLDEITTLSKPLQAKLLRVVQEREFIPLGSTKVEKFHAKLISASSNSIRDAVVNGEFREDLFYRLNIITFSLPALRDRGSDKLLIARHYLKKYSAIEKKDFLGFSKGCQKIIDQYQWPGNVRQLENVIHGIIILNNGLKINSQMIINALSTTICTLENQQMLAALRETKSPYQAPSYDQQLPQRHQPEHFQPAHQQPEHRLAEQQDHPLPTSHGISPLWLVEKLAIEQAISYCQGNVPQAAALLEVSPSTIYRKKQSWEQ
ncbi:MAG: sigma-54-dependent Fis family transcriptional regulator [Gammaproteobacteria bacterium]|nr:sigma-54-dependent Fis family transcriptional regulator [Gammaproteobacteria bacterium]